jgi:hypothetical protein
LGDFSGTVYCYNANSPPSNKSVLYKIHGNYKIDFSIIDETTQAEETIWKSDVNEVESPNIKPYLNEFSPSKSSHDEFKFSANKKELAPTDSRKRPDLIAL